MRLNKRDREIHLDCSGGTQSFVLNGIRGWFSSHLRLISRDAPAEASFFGDDPAFKIPASIESSSNQRYQEFRRENKDDSRTPRHITVSKSKKQEIFMTQQMGFGRFDGKVIIAGLVKSGQYSNSMMVLFS